MAYPWIHLTIIELHHLATRVSLYGTFESSYSLLWFFLNETRLQMEQGQRKGLVTLILNSRAHAEEPSPHWKRNRPTLDSGTCPNRGLVLWTEASSVAVARRMGRRIKAQESRIVEREDLGRTFHGQVEVRRRDRSITATHRKRGI